MDSPSKAVDKHSVVGPNQRYIRKKKVDHSRIFMTETDFRVRDTVPCIILCARCQHMFGAGNVYIGEFNLNTQGRIFLKGSPAINNHAWETIMGTKLIGTDPYYGHINDDQACPCGWTTKLFEYTLGPEVQKAWDNYNKGKQ
jgi:hypothetical protein